MGFLTGFHGHSKFIESKLAPAAARRGDHQLSALAVHRHRLVVDLASEKHRLSKRLAHGERELVAGERRLHRAAHRALGAKEAIRGHHAAESLVRAKVVVVGEIVVKPLARFFESLRPRATPQFLLDRLPQPLALAHGLRVMRARHHVLDPLADEQLLKVALPAPRVVLPPLVGQHFLGLAKLGDPLEQRLAHELLALVEREAKAHHVPAVIIQEDGEEDALTVAGEHEARNVALPQIARVGALEAPRKRRLPPALRHRRGTRERLLAANLRHSPRAHFHPREAREKVHDLSQAKVREALLHRGDLITHRGR
jgi:hypothetical protein